MVKIYFSSTAAALRRPLIAVVAALALLTMSGVFAPSANAESDFSVTYTSAKGGWGHATWDNSSSAERYLSACDEGTPDGLRTVAELAVGGVQYELHAASGSGKCTGKMWVSGLSSGSSFSFRACLRDGPNGRDVHCDEWDSGVVY